ncbi:MAG: ABC transporter substrate-binding protein [Acidimicrobiia bacterium]|nr:ABC transporter substrate-binding protein [Acidimicrobiia bacterium]
MHRKRGLFALLLALAMVIAACGGDETADTTGEGGTDSGGLAAGDGSVDVFGAFSGIEAEAVNQVITDQINGADGVEYTAEYEGSDSFEEQIKIRVEGGNAPDIAIYPQPGSVVEQAADGNAIALEDLGYDIAELEGIFGDYLLSLGEYEGKHYGIPTNVNLKSTVWYNVKAFDAAGYTPPATWDELIALSDQIVADGGTPWCIGLGSDAATGWPATDWMEDIMLATAGTDAYDRWVTHELPFASDEVKRAAEVFGEILFTDGYVLGGGNQTPSIDFRDAPDPMFSDPPGCYLHRQATFITNFFDPAGLVAGEDFNFFPFPAIDQNGVLIAGELAAVFNADTDVKDFLDRFISADVQCAQGSIEGISRISPNINVGSDCYRDALIGQAADVITAGLGAGEARFDASDLMPSAVGSGAFWTGMVDYAQNGPDALDGILADIDAAWPTS